MEEFNNMKQEMIDELEAKIKLNREKQRHLYNEIDRYEIALDKLKGQIH